VKEEFERLWRGELPLSRAVVGYVIIYGLAINVLMSGLALLAYTMTSSAALTLILHLGALPYNILACVGAWKSIDRHRGSPSIAALARVLVAGSFVLMVVL